MYIRVKDLFKGAKVVVVEEGTYTDTGNKYRSISINGKKYSKRFNSFVNPRCANGYTDYKRDKIVLASDGFMKDNTIQVFGIPFQVEERVSRKKEKYLAILLNGRKIGYFINNKQRATFNKVCL